MTNHPGKQVDLILKLRFQKVNCFKEKIQLSKDWYLNTGAGVEEADGKVFFNEALVAQ